MFSCSCLYSTLISLNGKEQLKHFLVFFCVPNISYKVFLSSKNLYLSQLQVLSSIWPQPKTKQLKTKTKPMYSSIKCHLITFVNIQMAVHLHVEFNSLCWHHVTTKWLCNSVTCNIPLIPIDSVSDHFNTSRDINTLCNRHLQNKQRVESKLTSENIDENIAPQ